MTDNLLPCLKDRAWPGRDQTTCRVLWPDKASEYMPWLAFGFDHPHTFEFLNSDKLTELGLTEAQVEAQALANLRKRPAQWQSVDTPLDGGKTLTMLICMDDFFAAERIADPAFLKEAQRQLGVPAILVGAPRRGVMMAAAVQDDEDVGRAFAAVVASQSHGGESAMVSPMLFVVSDGAIIGLMESIADAMAAQQPAGDGEAAEDADAPYVSAMTVKNDAGKLEVHIVGGGEDGDRLVRGFEDAFPQLFKKYNEDPAFARKVKFLVFGYTPQAARDKMPRLMEHMRGLMADLQKSGVAPIEFELEIQKDSPFGSGGAAAPAAQAAEAPRPAAAPSRSAWYYLKLAFQLVAVAIILYGMWERFTQ